MAVKEEFLTITRRPEIALTICTDSRSLYGLCISLSPTTEKRLQIDLAIISEVYEAREITKLDAVETVVHQDCIKASHANITSLSTFDQTMKNTRVCLTWIQKYSILQE